MRARPARLGAFLAGAACCVGAGILLIQGAAQYKGSLSTYLAFNAAFLLLPVLALPRPRLYVYTFFAAFLFLGFWLKVVVQAAWDIGFIEPTGEFAGTPAQWDTALLLATCAALGMAGARILHLVLVQRSGKYRSATEHDPAPAWFVRYRRPVWVASIALIAILNTLNIQLAFFQIGVNPSVILPLRLNVLAAWLINIGFALWVAALVWWEFRARPRSCSLALVAPMFEAFSSSVSALSRLIYVIHAGPYWVALWERRHDVGRSLRRSALALLTASFVAFFCMSILTVLMFRILDYHDFSTLIPRESTRQEHRALVSKERQELSVKLTLLGDEVVLEHYARVIAYEVPHLFVHRWMGLEGVLAAASAPEAGRDLLVAMVTDDPKLGYHSLYQRVVKSPFVQDKSGRLTFLSNAGIVAILSFSGSLAVVGFGMLLLTGILLATEWVAERATGNPFFLAVAAGGLASVMSQTTYPYLTAVFVLQLWVAIGFVAAAERLRFGSVAQERPV
jgi:hypothetical protein